MTRIKDIGQPEATRSLDDILEMDRISLKSRMEDLALKEDISWSSVPIDL